MTKEIHYGTYPDGSMEHPPGGCKTIKLFVTNKNSTLCDHSRRQATFYLAYTSNDIIP